MILKHSRRKGMMSDTSPEALERSGGKSFSAGDAAGPRPNGDRFRLTLVRLVAIVTLGSGLLNLYSLIARPIPQRLAAIEEVFPLEFVHLSRFLTMLIGFALVISSVNIYRRKRRAFQSVLVLSSLSVVFHLIRGLHFEEALVSLFLVIVLLSGRRIFTVKSSLQSLPLAFVRAGLGVAIAFAYGSLGFWLIERRHFRFNFGWRDAILEAARYVSLVGDPGLVPYTRHAAWFIDSLYLISVTAIAYAIYALFRPMVYKFRVYPRELARAREITQEHGRSAIDFFKYWPDKSFFLSPSEQSFIAYSVGGGFAVALGDAVGPEDETEEVTGGFLAYCAENGWGVAFHQTLPDFQLIYDKLGLRKLKVGDDAIVDLTSFSLEGRARKSLRQAVNRVEELGIRLEIIQSPVPNEILDKTKVISDKWLAISGHRERRFTLGRFDRDYLSSTPVALALNNENKPLAFVNVVPSFFPGETTIDLMRRLPDSPNGLMDFVFVKLFLHLKVRGFRRFNMGMAPMAGFGRQEPSTAEERAIHFFFQHLNFLFRYRGLKNFKAKFATSWEPRYAVYRNPLDLPKLALALRKITELGK